MTLEQLKALVWVARLKAFGAAAEKLNATQPGVSNRIRRLEHEVGVVLFERTTRFVRITREGKECLRIAERILGLAKEITVTVGARDHLAGSVTIGVSNAIAMTWLPELMAQLDQDYPLLEVNFELGVTTSLFERLTAGDVEILLCGGIPAGTITQSFVIDELGCLEWAWMGAARGKHIPPGNKPLRPKDLQALRIIANTRSSIINHQMEAWFRQDGARVRKSIRCDDVSSIASLIAEDLGVGLLPTALFQDRRAHPEIRRIATTPEFPPMQYYAVHVPGPDDIFPGLVAKIAKRVSTFPRALPVPPPVEKA